MFQFTACKILLTKRVAYRECLHACKHISTVFKFNKQNEKIIQVFVFCSYCVFLCEWNTTRTKNILFIIINYKLRNRFLSVNTKKEHLFTTRTKSCLTFCCSATRQGSSLPGFKIWACSTTIRAISCTKRCHWLPMSAIWCIRASFWRQDFSLSKLLFFYS